MRESIVIAVLFRITWILVSLTVCVHIASPLAYVCMGLLFSFCFCCVNYCEAVIEKPEGDLKTTGWQITSSIFSWATTAATFLLLAYTLGFPNV